MRIVAYHRVSTAAQGRSGLGLEAQQAAIEAFAASRGARVIASYTEVESGKRDDRPQLAAALHRAKVTGATLVIAKLDRLSRNVAFLASLHDSGVQFVAADMPEANELTVHIMAAVAQAERKATAKRTREALQAAKARGVRLGNPNGAAALKRAGKGNVASLEAIGARADAFAEDLALVLKDIMAAGVTSLDGIARELTAREIKTPRGGRWHPSSVQNLMRRLSF
ncbi:recombinase family protein [Sandarakinorhabdus sp. DWP1-3-1]|uniref:recombinase family protein n=1 Tax=Sandarakinorhabdus sp. DWP1-3-1 TaxID=2804627 RepID=UPI003CF04B0B